MTPSAILQLRVWLALAANAVCHISAVIQLLIQTSYAKSLEPNADLYANVPCCATCKACLWSTSSENRTTENCFVCSTLIALLSNNALTAC